MHLVKSQALTAIPEKTVGFINGIHQYVFILLLLLLYFFRFNLSLDEEHYMVLAKAFFDAGWLPESFCFSGFASTRVLYQYVAGFMLSFLSFEAAAALGKLLLCIFLAFSLHKIYSYFQLSNIDILLHLPLLYLARQSFFGEEFIFLAFEPKELSYVFALFGLYYMLTDKFKLATLFFLIATYFHLLVGGWLMGYFLLYHLISGRSFWRTFKLGAAYLIGFIPFGLYLLPAFTDNFSTTATPVHIDWIYTYFKQPYHTALFSNPAYFQKGFLISLAFFIIITVVFNRFEDDRNRKISLFSQLLFTGTFVALVIAYFDKNGSFVKYFPFRVNAIFVFLFHLQLVFLLRYFFLKRKNLVYYQFAVLTFFFFAVFPREMKALILDDLKPYLAGSFFDRPYEDITGYIKKNTDKKDVFLLLSKDGKPGDVYSYDMSIPFVRKAERDRFVAFYAAPIAPGSDALYQWYQRILVKGKMVEDYRQLCSYLDDYKIDYLLTDFPLDGDLCYRLEYQNEGYFLYNLE